uniref:Uncharacterized protein n=1 Tax=Acartia pacifica TaxID=335913 RepID=A0A0U2V674_ACAPC|nr:hypothetical protein [Acartia pacifica]
MRVAALFYACLLLANHSAARPQNNFLGIPPIGGLTQTQATIGAALGLGGAVLGGALLGSKAAQLTNSLFRRNRNRGKRSLGPIFLMRN